MVKSFSFAALALAATLAFAASSTSNMVDAAAMPTGSWPASKGTVKLAAPQVVKAGTTFDGGMKTYELANVKCQGQKESSKNTMVFLVEPGATLKNVIIGKNQMEGVHCEKSGCTIENVWWDDVCEDALSVKGGSAKSVTKVIGGGARYAEDKVIQHNGLGTVNIDGFYAQDFGKLYRSCGTCGTTQRNVVLTNVYALNPTNSVVTVNQNNKDTAKFKNVYVKSSKGNKVKVCQWSSATNGGEPKMVGNGPSGTLCQYTTSDVHFTAPEARSYEDDEEFDFSLLSNSTA